MQEHITIKADPEVVSYITSIVKDLNKFILKGKVDVFGSDVEYLTSKYNINDLLLMGCKQVTSYNGVYIELPYEELDEDKIDEYILRREIIKNMMKGNENERN